MVMGSVYCVFKFGLVGLSKCMVDELWCYGIKVIFFYFGGVNMFFWDNVSLKVDCLKMLSLEIVVDVIMFVFNVEF